MKKQTIAFLLALTALLTISENKVFAARYVDGGRTGHAPAAPQETFSYVQPKPVNGVLKGVVELGSTGFNYFVINVDKQKNWELVKVEYGNSLVSEHMENDNDILMGLKGYINRMVEATGVTGNNIHFVVSSGADRDPKVIKIIAQLRKLRYVVNAVTFAQEGAYGLLATMPKDYYDSAFFIDMGSGNTKVAYVENGKTIGLETIGSKYFEKQVSDEDAYKQVMAVCSKIPAGKRAKCFIIGGGPFELAKPVRKEKEQFTILNGPDSYEKLIADKGQKVKCAVNIYKAIQQATGCHQFIFDWDTDFTIGFLLSLK